MFKFILPKMIMKIERWKWNKEFRIYVSNMGNFKDEYKKNIPVRINRGGYVMIKTPYGNKLAHRLVMMTWQPIPNAEDLTVDHLNHNKRDNSVYNLEWVTVDENLKRAAEDLIDEGFVPVPAPKPSNARIFQNVEDAYAWLLAHDKAVANQPNMIPDRVKAKILRASQTGEKYANHHWHIA